MPTPCIFASYSGASSCKMDCHWGVALRKVLYQEWCVSTRKTWTQHLGLTNMFCMNRFRDWEKLLGHYCILVLVFSWREVISESSVYAHFLISSFLIYLNSSRLFYRWSYGILLYEIFTIGKLFRLGYSVLAICFITTQLVQIATVAGLGRKNSWTMIQKGIVVWNIFTYVKVLEYVRVC